MVFNSWNFKHESSVSFCSFPAKLGAIYFINCFFSPPVTVSLPLWNWSTPKCDRPWHITESLSEDTGRLTQLRRRFVGGPWGISCNMRENQKKKKKRATNMHLLKQHQVITCNKHLNIVPPDTDGTAYLCDMPKLLNKSIILLFITV